MLKLYNKEHVAVAALTNLKDYKREYLLSGEDQVEFSLSICDENINLVEEEGYVRTKFNEYVIKAVDPSQNFKRFSCIVNIEDIKAKSIKNFDTINNTITEVIRLAIAGTGWILADNNISKRRTVRVKNTDALGVLREVRKVFMIDYRFDAINKVIYVYEHFGSDKGVYFSDELNLKTLTVPSDTYDYATRLYCYGKEDLNIASINRGKEYVENFQYSNKVIEKIWTDDRYTIAESLKEDAEAKLEEISKPKRSYKAEIIDLARNNKEYKFLDFFLGDTITLLSKAEKFRDKQRIVKYIEYPNDPSKNTCELGNARLTFEELQKENEAKNQVINNITSDNGTVNGDSIDSIKTDQISDFETSVAKITDLTVVNAEISNLKAQNATITGELNAVKANIGTLIANVATIDNLTVTHTAQINNLIATSATITQLNAVSATIGTLEVEVGKIQTLVNGNLSSENIQAGGITSDKLTIANGFITNAMIANLDVSKVNAGDISTNKFRIVSNDGGIEIVGATQQFKDKNNKVRIQMGKDAQGNFNFIIRGEDGTSTLIDHTGVKEKAIADDLIKSNMIASDAVGEKQIDYNSFSKGFNKDTNTTTLKATKIKLDNQNQTLDIAFNQLKTQSDETKSLTENHSTTIGVMQGQISTAINNTQIVKDGQTILLKDDYNRTVATVDSMKSTIGSHTTQINSATGKINSVETKVNTVERNLNSITARVSSTETNITTIRDTANNANNKIDNLQIGGTNLVSDNRDVFRRTQSMPTYDKNTHTWTLTIANNEDNTWGAGLRIGDKNVRIPYGKTFILSFEIFVPVACQWNMDINNYPVEGANWAGNDHDNTASRKSSPKQLQPNKWVKCWFSYTNNSSDNTKFVDLFDNSNFGVINTTGSNMTYKIRNIKGELGNTPTDWSPCPYDLQIEITKTNNKVASIETNLSSITSRVSSVETTNANINGQVSNLSSRLSVAEQKITDASIISIVSSQFYKKGETDSKYASKSQITQLDNKISLKVDVNGVISSINQTAESIKIKASKIDIAGATTIGNAVNGRYVEIQNETFRVKNGNTPCMHLGYRTWQGYTGVPEFLMGHDGFIYSETAGAPYSGTYFGMSTFGNDKNPENTKPYHSIYYRSRTRADETQLNFYEDGRTRLKSMGAFALIADKNTYIQASVSTGLQFDNGFASRRDSTIDGNLILNKNILMNGQIYTKDLKQGFGIEQYWGKDEYMLRKMTINPMDLGYDTPESRFRTIYASNGIINTSDARLKKNIKPIQDVNIVPYNFPTLVQLPPSEVLAKIDYYNFVKEMSFYTYDYISADDSNRSLHNVGFIAQDIANHPVGKEFIFKDKANMYQYNEKSYVGVLGVALQKAIYEIEKLKLEIQQLRAS